MTDRLTMDALFLAKVETTAGVDATPVAASDAVRVYEVFDPKGAFKFKTERPHVIRGTNRTARTPLTPSGRSGTWPVKVYGRGSPNTTAFSASVKPEADALLQAAGFSSTGSFGAGVETYTYAIDPTAPHHVTCYSYSGGKLRKMLGSIAQLKMMWKSGGPIDYDFSIQGLYQAPTDVATPGSPVFGTSVGPIADGATVSFAGNSALIIREFEYDTGNTIVERPQANVAGGLAYPRLTYSKGTFKLTIEDPPVATLDLEGLQLSATPEALTWTIGSVQYNKCQFTAPAVVIETYDVSNDNGIPIATISGGVYDSTDTATDAVSLVWK